MVMVGVERSVRPIGTTGASVLARSSSGVLLRACMQQHGIGGGWRTVMLLLLLLLLLVVAPIVGGSCRRRWSLHPGAMRHMHAGGGEKLCHKITTIVMLASMHWEH